MEKRKGIKKLGILFCLWLSVFPLTAHIKLSALFTDNMVLQQRAETPVWGTATPDKEVRVTASWEKKTYTVKAGTDGKWQVILRTTQAGGPHFITISDGKETITLKNVLLGEVWLCSGQSNMEMPVGGWGKVDNYKEEISHADFATIRFLQVKKTASTKLADEVQTLGEWKECSPATLSDFSATAYFFGRSINENLKVPVGLIDASWGGTVAESWVSGASLERMYDFRTAVQKIEDAEVVTPETYELQLSQWNRQILAEDMGFNNKHVAEWAAPNYDDSDWDTMVLPAIWEQNELPDFDGVVWFRKMITIPAAWEDRDLTLSLDQIDDNDIAYFNGKEIGATDGYSIARLYTIPAKLVKKGRAVITVRVVDTGGNGGINGDRFNIYIGPKSERISTAMSLSGEWRYQPTVNLQDFPAPQNPNEPNRPSVLFNSMIHPLVPFAIQGVIWYQGESNVGRADQYKTLFPLLIQDWRNAWERNFPFYYVQLANYMERKAEPEDSQWARLREAQLQTLEVENTGMAVAIDLGEADDIHPKNKQDVGKRLSLIALENVYKPKQKVVFSGPVYQSYEVDGNKIRIRFTHTETGLKIGEGKKLEGFAIAGADRQFYWADAVVKGNDIIVTSPKVTSPVAVRYAWADNPACNLRNGAGLPASPFRTDDWE
ncbi:MAG: 9-O-acetylesterase [Dysgonamonadaceae bacterium]|jgi:sialate O-acetylesterase|nr:9-O-acetylesterase [Dysgonamonadaceae bacterium]